MSNFYPNFVPIQEMSDWFEPWATRGVKPFFTCEYGAPFTWDWSMYRGWYQGSRSFGSAVVPWDFCLAEWNAQFLGDAAFRVNLLSYVSFGSGFKDILPGFTRWCSRKSYLYRFSVDGKCIRAAAGCHIFQCPVFIVIIKVYPEFIRTCLLKLMFNFIESGPVFCGVRNLI